MQYTVALFRKYCSQNYSKFMILYYLLDLSHWISIGRLKVDQIYDTVTTMHKYRRSKCDLRAKPTGNRGLPWRKIRIAGKMKQGTVPRKRKIFRQQLCGRQNQKQRKTLKQDPNLDWTDSVFTNLILTHLRNKKLRTLKPLRGPNKRETRSSIREKNK
jgi:hypothetical protein